MFRARIFQYFIFNLSDAEMVATRYRWSSKSERTPTKNLIMDVHLPQELRVPFWGKEEVFSFEKDIYFPSSVSSYIIGFSFSQQPQRDGTGEEYILTNELEKVCLKNLTET